MKRTQFVGAVGILQIYCSAAEKPPHKMREQLPTEKLVF